MRFELVLSKIWQNLERSLKFYENCENIQEFEFEAVRRYVESFGFDFLLKFSEKLNRPACLPNQPTNHRLPKFKVQT